MNCKLFSTLFVILLCINGYAETVFQLKKTLFMKPGDIKNGFTLGDSTEKMINVLGLPDDIIAYYSEIGEAYGEIYCYQQNEVFIINNKVDGFSIRDESIAFGIVNKFQLKVGDEIEEIESIRVDINKFNKIGTYYDFYPIIFEKGRAYNLDYDAYFSPEYFYDRNVRLDSSFSILFKNNQVVFVSMISSDY